MNKSFSNTDSIYKNDEIDLLRHQIIQTERKLKDLKTVLLKKVKN